jgi:hypothetical protein
MIDEIPTNSVAYVYAFTEKDGKALFRGVAADWTNRTSPVYIWDGHSWVNMGLIVDDLTSESKLDLCSLLDARKEDIWEISEPTDLFD